jgi:single-strand DNA-binding protein
MSSLNLNKVVLVGRLTADPELKQTTSGVSVCAFTLAVNRRYHGAANGAPSKPQADFISIVAWRQTAEFITKYFDKGNAICITGSLQTRTWEDDMGRKRHATDVVADEAMFVDGKQATENAFDGKGEQELTYTNQKPVEPKFEELSTDDDLPF